MDRVYRLVISCPDGVGIVAKVSDYNLSDGPSTQNHRITKAYFRTCSTRQSRSQAPLCFCTLRLVSNQAEGTFARLRYDLGGDRPSQTTHQTVSWTRITGHS